MLKGELCPSEQPRPGRIYDDVLDGRPLEDKSVEMALVLEVGGCKLVLRLSHFGFPLQVKEPGLSRHEHIHHYLCISDIWTLITTNR